MTPAISRGRVPVGALLGNYRLVQSIGEGGMGYVYLARHEHLGRTFAIKVLRPEFSRFDELTSRFFEEAKLTAAIEHPDVVEVYDFGVAEDGTAFFVMEHLDGETLRDRLHRCGRLSVESALAIASSVASVLAAAHRAGIIHRDIKPENIFLLDDAIRPRVKVLDFGIAKLAFESSQVRTETAAGVLLGTPSYMAPEQCCGDPVDGRTDLYALGCLLFEMLCGDPPFDGDGAEVIMAHVHTQPPIPTSRVRGLSEHIDRLIARLLAKRPNERLDSAEALLDSLKTIEWSPTLAERRKLRRFSASRVRSSARYAAISTLVAAGVVGALVAHNAAKREAHLPLEVRATDTPPAEPLDASVLAAQEVSTDAAPVVDANAETQASERADSAPTRPIRKVFAKPAGSKSTPPDSASLAGDNLIAPPGRANAPGQKVLVPLDDAIIDRAAAPIPSD